MGGNEEGLGGNGRACGGVRGNGDYRMKLELSG